MKDPRVEFLQSDAFAFEPLRPVTWMVSDIVSYPERIVELLDHWCKHQLATNIVVTMKFQGSDPSWDQLDLAFKTAADHGYLARAKHFFNNKNEVTLMLRRSGKEDAHTNSVTSAAICKTTIPPFYRPTL